MPSDPVASLIVFCDHIITEQGSGKNSLIGTFQHLGSPTFPFFYPRLFVHIAVTNFTPSSNKTASLAVNFKNTQTGAVVASLGFPLNLPPTPKEKLPANGVKLLFNLPLQNLMFQTPGVYECEVLFNSEPIGSSFLEVVQVPHPQPPFTPQAT